MAQGRTKKLKQVDKAPAPPAAARAAAVALIADTVAVQLDSSQIYANTLKALTSARDTMLTLDWHLELNSEPPEVQQTAAKTLASLESTIMALSNKRLAEIAARMTASQKDLQDAADGIDDAQQKLDNVIGFINAAAAIVTLVGKVIAAA
jgi:hypothetical protein